MTTRLPASLALLLFTLPGLLGVSRALADTDEDTAQRVRVALAAAHVTEAPQLTISVFNGTADIAGVVHSDATRLKVERVAATVRGVTAVQNDLSVGTGPAAGGDADAALAARVHRTLAANGIAEEPQLTITAFNGDVELAGNVHSTAARDSIVRLTNTVRGVTAVRDSLAVRPDGAVEPIDGDEAITARVHRALAASALGNIGQIEVRTFHGEVDLTGSVTSEYARGEVVRLVGTVRGVTAVHDALTTPGR